MNLVRKLSQKLIFLSVLSILIVKEVKGQQKQPNVILVLTDDQGWGDLSMHGNPWVETPNIDGLTKEGVALNNFYVSPLCAPSRAEILTGRNHLATGVISVSRGLEILNTEESTLGELFKANNYKTGIFGKWHNGEHYPNTPNDQGFDEFLGFTAGHWSNYFDTKLNHNGEMVKTKGFISDVLTDAAINFMENNRSKPFFCYVPFNAPHSPFQLADEYFNKYKAKNLDDELACVYGMVDNMDYNVGRILKFLKENNLEENTIVIFLSDNGPNTVRFNGGLTGIKGTVHEGGVKVPFIIKWKNKLPENKTLDSPTAGIDIYPTLISLCGLKSIGTKPLDGRDISSLFLKQDDTLGDRALFTHVNFMQVPINRNLGGFRDKQYRFALEADKPELYNLRTDPFEKQNLAGENEQLTEKYLNKYEVWFESQIKNLSYFGPIVLTQRGAELFTYEADISSGLKFKEGHGWAHDWISSWRNNKDSIQWNIDCQTSGEYRVNLTYLCKKDQIGSMVKITIGDRNLTKRIDKPFESAVVFSPDRVPRKEVYDMEEWGNLEAGTIYIPKGKMKVSIKVPLIKERNAMELYSIKLIRNDVDFSKNN